MLLPVGDGPGAVDPHGSRDNRQVVAARVGQVSTAGRHRGRRVEHPGKPAQQRGRGGTYYTPGIPPTVSFVYLFISLFVIKGVVKYYKGKTFLLKL